MFATYRYKANTQAANLLADIRKIFTGETNLANLSVDCDTANTVILSTVAAGWESHDDNAGTDTFVIKSPHADNGALYKYLQIRYASNTLYFKGHETWDAIANTGTNSTPETSGQTVSLAEGGILYLASNARYAIVTGYLFSTMAFSYAMLVASEYTRGLPWCTTSYPAFAVFNCKDASYYGVSGETNIKKVYPIRALNLGGSTVTGVGAAAYLGTVGHFFYADFDGSGTEFINSPSMRLKDLVGNARIPLWPLFLFEHDKYGPRLGEFSSLSGFYAVQTKVADRLLSFSSNSNNYIIIPAHRESVSYEFNIAVRKG